MSLFIVRNDITRMNVSAVVNAANTELLCGGGVCGAIFAKAGRYKLQEACDKLSPIKMGEAVITPGFGLTAKFIIHAAGPVYNKCAPSESESLLRQTYLNSLRLAKDDNCASVAFPLISSGIYGYPKEAALRIATDAIKEFLASNDLEVYLVLLDQEAFLVGEELYGKIKSYIEESTTNSPEATYGMFSRRTRRAILDVEERALREGRSYSTSAASLRISRKEDSISALVKELDIPFNIALIKIIQKKGLSDVDVYKKANLSRKLFSKIRTGNKYMPSKRTILALAIAMQLDLTETKDLLSRAGYALTRNQKLDVIVEYFIVHGEFDIYKINRALYDFDQPLLGGGN